MKSNEKKNLTLKLTPLENAVIHTKTEKSYLELMKVYEVGGWSFMLGGLPTEKNYWKRFKEKTCITTKVEYGFSPRNYYQERERKRGVGSNFERIKQCNNETM